MKTFSGHVPVLEREVLEEAPSSTSRVLDVTAGGGGHLCAFLRAFPQARAFAYDQDPRAVARVGERLEREGLQDRVHLLHQSFATAVGSREYFDVILADLGVSSFQFDPEHSGMSLFSDLPPDFRMNPEHGLPFPEWLRSQSELKLADILFKYAEEPKAKSLAKELKRIPGEALRSAKDLASWIRRSLGYQNSKVHPATRIFQALRMEINQEFEQLQQFLLWAPEALSLGGRLMVISFHSIEDRLVKRAFLDLEATGQYKILTKKPILPKSDEVESNPPSRSAKMRILERVK